jgi:hypothetical protein
MRKNLFGSILFVLCAAATLSAQPADGGKAPGFRDLFLNQLKDVETKVVGLAEAMPQEKYTWRPAEGVRSISEVYSTLRARITFCRRSWVSRRLRG